MSEGCAGSLGKGKDVIDLVRSKGFSDKVMDEPMEISCECGESFEMKTFEAMCPNCGMVYGVTPCHADSVDNVRAAGKDY